MDILSRKNDLWPSAWQSISARLKKPNYRRLLIVPLVNRCSCVRKLCFKVENRIWREGEGGGGVVEMQMRAPLSEENSCKRDSNANSSQPRDS
jgi:hypothetical protein